MIQRGEAHSNPNFPYMATSLKSALRQKLPYRINGSLWIECGSVRFFGPGPAELLERIDKTGSLRQAAKQMKMSYRKAWQIVSAVNARMAKPVVILHSGGQSGGGSSLTPEAKKMLVYHAALRKRFASFLEKESKKLTSK